MSKVHVLEGACARVEYFSYGMMSNNVYVIADSKSCFAVDPICSAAELIEVLAGRKLDAIVLTHRHFDHVGGAYELRKSTSAPVIASSVDAPVIAGEEPLPRGDRGFKTCPVDIRLEDGQMLELGDMQWKTMLTPGHTQGSMCLYLEPRSGETGGCAPILISGDTLFCGTIGRTDFSGGCLSEMRRSLTKLAQLPDNTLVLPGHDMLTTIGAERNRVFSSFAI